VRRKTFALHPLDHEAAALEMDQLDHDFFLFTDRETGADAVVERHTGGGVRAGTGDAGAGAGADDEAGHEVHHSVITGPPALRGCGVMAR
jgi:hypothetical protein